MTDPMCGWSTPRWQAAAWFGLCIWQFPSGSSTRVKGFPPYNCTLRGCLQLLRIPWIVPFIPSSEQRLLKGELVCGGDFFFHASNLLHCQPSSSRTLLLSHQFWMSSVWSVPYLLCHLVRFFRETWAAKLTVSLHEWGVGQGDFQSCCPASTVPWFSSHLPNDLLLSWHGLDAVTSHQTCCSALGSLYPSHVSTLLPASVSSISFLNWTR